MTHIAQNLSMCARSPSPEENEDFNLAAHLIERPYDTFYVRVSGSSMIDAGIFDGDILIVDRSIKPKPTDVVVVQIGHSFTVKKFIGEHGHLRLVPSETRAGEFRICGVATFAIHRL